ncbi:MAG: ABC transporter permease [Bacillota bacterium]
MTREWLEKFATDFRWILRGQLYGLRTQWFWYLVFLSFSPLTFLFFLWLYGGAKSPEATLYIVTGSVANSAVTAAMLSLGQSIGSMRMQNALEYYASLPVSKLAFILAVATRGVLFAFPSSFVVLIIGAVAMGLPLAPAIGPTILVYFLSAYSLAGLGAVVGFYGRTPEAVGLATQIVQPFLVLFAPVYVPMAQLPAALRVAARYLPTTYVAEALRAAITGSLGARFWLDTGVIAAFTVAGLALAHARADWRVSGA